MTPILRDSIRALCGATLLLALRGRYQPWVYQYPSGIRLPRAASLLAHLIGSLHRELGFERLFVTAHSMGGAGGPVVPAPDRRGGPTGDGAPTAWGGLVARSSLLQTEEVARPAMALLVTFSTPWDGHLGAKHGVKYAPAVVPAWIDMQPGSDFIESLRADLPPGLPHHLFFGFKTGKNPLMLYSHDTVVSVASQLAPWAQERQTRFVAALADLDGVADRAVAVELAAAAESEEEALFQTGAAIMLGWLHGGGDALARLAPSAVIPVALTADGRLAVAAPLDYTVWTAQLAAGIERLAELGARLGAERRELWFRGKVSERCRRELEARGWKVRTEVAAPS